jgi:hypothetical protein
MRINLDVVQTDAKNHEFNTKRVELKKEKKKET